jgi:hypothetical protein
MSSTNDSATQAPLGHDVGASPSPDDLGSVPSIYAHLIPTLTKSPFLIGRLSNLSGVVTPANSQQRKCFGIGDELCVFVVLVDAFKREVDFAIAQQGDRGRK